MSAAVDQALGIEFVEYCANTGHASTKSSLVRRLMEDVMCQCRGLRVKDNAEVMSSHVGCVIEGLRECSLEQSPVYFFEVEIPLAGNRHGNRLDSYLLVIAAVCFECALCSLENKAQELVECLLQALVEKLSANLPSLVPQSLKNEVLIKEPLVLAREYIGYEFGRRFFTVGLLCVAYVLDEFVIMYEDATCELSQVVERGVRIFPVLNDPLLDTRTVIPRNCHAGFCASDVNC